MAKFNFWGPADESRSGTFYGHVIGGICHALFGSLFLFLMLHRSLRLPPGKTYVQEHLPERNLMFLSTMGKVMLVSTSFGMLIEIPGELS
jgi:hypothetical protein